MNTYRYYCNISPNSREVTTHGPQEGKNQNGNWVLRLGLPHPVRPARWKWWLDQESLPASRTPGSQLLIPCTHHFCSHPSTRLRISFPQCAFPSHQVTKPHRLRAKSRYAQGIKHIPREQLTWTQGQNHQQALRSSADIGYKLQGHISFQRLIPVSWG